MNNKAREALEEIWSCADYIYSYPTNIGGVQECSRDIMEMIYKIKSEPLRNCDVGTAKEQDKRFDAFCYAHRSNEKGCENCPLLNGVPCCELAWAQMPYESEVKE